MSHVSLSKVCLSRVGYDTKQTQVHIKTNSYDESNWNVAKNWVYITVHNHTLLR